MEQQPNVIERTLPPWAEQLWTNKSWKYLYAWGGRMGLKTQTIMAYILWDIMQPVPERHKPRAGPQSCKGSWWGIFRENENDLDDSIFEEFQNLAEIFQVLQYFHYLRKDRKLIFTPTGADIRLRGLYTRKGSRRGLAGSRGIWVDETQEVRSMKALTGLESTIRRFPEVKLMYSFNRDDGSPIWRMMEQKQKNKDPFSIIVKAQWDDANMLADDALDYLNQFERDFPDKFAAEFEGAADLNTEAQVFRHGEHWIKEDLDQYVKDRELTPVYGLDPGWTRSAAALVEAYNIPDFEDGHCVYISRVHYARNMTARDYPSFVAGYDTSHAFPRWENHRQFEGMLHPADIHRHAIYSDTDIAAIAELAGTGFRIEKAKSIQKRSKGRGEDPKTKKQIVRGIEFMQRLPGMVRLHPKNCATYIDGEEIGNLYNEFIQKQYMERKDLPGAYSYEDFVKGYDHGLDATRYALSLAINAFYAIQQPKLTRFEDDFRGDWAFQ